MFEGLLKTIREVIETITMDRETPIGKEDRELAILKLTDVSAMLENEVRRRWSAEGPLPVVQALRLFRDLSANTSGPSWQEIDALLERAAADERERYPLALSKLRKALEKEKREDVSGYGSLDGQRCDWPRIFAILDQAAEESIAVAKRTIEMVEKLRQLEHLELGFWVSLESGWFKFPAGTEPPPTSVAIRLFMFEGQARALVFPQIFGDTGFHGFLISKGSRALSPQCIGSDLAQVQGILASAVRTLAHNERNKLTPEDFQIPSASPLFEMEQLEMELAAEKERSDAPAEIKRQIKRQIESLQIDLRVEKTLVDGLTKARDALVEELQTSRALTESIREGSRLLDILAGLREHSTEVRDAVARAETAESEVERLRGELSAMWEKNRPTQPGWTP
jgi:hypothetical protein